VLLDTDVFSYMNKRTDPRGEIYRQKVQGKLLCVCFVTVGELLFGAYKAKWGAAKLEQLKARLRSVVIVPYDIAVCQTYADLKTRLQEAGKCVADNDLWIAACAVRHSIPLVSNNRAHFEVIPSLILISEAAVITEIQSQQKISYEKPNPSDEPGPSSSQSSSS
jgi:predicted nucleic acid-binding protein